MDKSNLPKNWIVVHSKTHPDRVYYFNVKTNESSWNAPAEDAQVKRKRQEPSRRSQRANDGSGSVSTRPTTPEYEEAADMAPKRKKLIARRSLKSTEATNEDKETPQMKILREKMLKKKEKNVTSKTCPSSSSKDMFGESSSSENLQKEKSVSETNKETEKELWTPQMKEIFQKMKQKPRKDSKAKVKKNTNDSSKIIDITDDTVSKESSTELKKLKRRSNISGRNNTIGITSDDEQEKEEDDISRKDVKKKMPVDDTSFGPRGSRTVGRVYKKNVDKERIEKLRKNLKTSNATSESNLNSITSVPDNDYSVLFNPSEQLPDVYKNVQVRLQRLSRRVSSGILPKDKNKFDETPKNIEHRAEATTTVKDLTERCNNSFDEEMDWEPMEDEEITYEVQAVRTQLYSGDNVAKTSSVPNNILSQSMASEQPEKKQLYIVIDTNVFLSNIHAVDAVKNCTFKNYDQPIIVIPWTVIRELDYIKDDKSKARPAALCAKARKAVHYINILFTSKSPRVFGQRPEDVAKNKDRFAVDCPDDEILQTCLQIRDTGKSVVLLSYDKNLCNKAMIYDLVTLGRNDPLEKLDYINVNNEGILQVSFHKQDNYAENVESPDESFHPEQLSELLGEAKAVIKEFLTVIVSKEMHGLYGHTWEKYVIIRPPWTVLTVLKCAIKHWIAATSESFHRKADNILKELLDIFKKRAGSNIDQKELDYVLNKCNDLIQMVNVDKHSDLMIRSSQKIDELRKRLREHEIRLNEKKLRDAIGVEDDLKEQERRAEKAFKHFEATYAYARDMCGLAAEAVGMPCSFPHDMPNPMPSLDYVKEIQPELAANVVRLMHSLSAVMEEMNDCNMDHRTMLSLYQALISFLPESLAVTSDLSPLDVYCCVKQKEEVLKTGLRQLQELSTHFCRLASYRCT